MSNFNKVQVSDSVAIWFSYDTPVAFEAGGETVVSENIWSRTTGRHLSKIEPDKGKRVSHDTFVQMYDAALSKALRG